MNPRDSKPAGSETTAWDHSSDERFTEHFAEHSRSRATVERVRRISDAIFRILAKRGPTIPGHPLDVLDVGCNAGTLCAFWAKAGHRAHGLDVNASLLEIASRRAADDALDIDFRLGSGVALPWADRTMDVCIANELLEHVEDWKTCVDEMMRVLKPGGVLCITTTNVYCPVQKEFRLPLYSWYPSFVKQRCVELATTTSPGLANYARYPALHWFSYFSLRRYVEPNGFDCYDRFDAADDRAVGPMKSAAIRLIRTVAPLRRLAYTAVAGTIFFGVKRRGPS